ncbi:CdaR family protein [Salimicrobium halophilum]|uniref:YbbR domain-containing protein n=1 Tax=Salimicrobium halophilum TaxID=86666 RepID=A0A1G8WLV2_9BACI|nr:CdaR family protein [Salimicrobium halophilum]SDJ79329.1 YbbR domain-containing protein [Salimicrobium halophilum]
MDKWLRSTWFIRILSLFLAVLMWASVSSENTSDSESFFLNGNSTDQELVENIPVDIRLDDEELVVSGVPQVANVTLEGPTSQIAPVARQQNFTLYVELNELGPGRHEVPIQHSGISSQIQVSTEPQTVEVTIERRVSHSFEASVDFINENQLQEGWEIGEPVIEPASVEITGAASVLSQVAVVKSIVNLSGVESSIEGKEAPVKVYDEEGNELNVIVEPSTVSIDVPVSRSQKAVPVTFQAEGDVANGANVNTITSSVEQVTIYGPRGVLNDINQVSGVPVDTEGLNETTTREVKIDLPDGVTAIEPKTAEVQIEITND